MTSSTRFHPEAEREFLEAASFYDLQRAGLGGDFFDEVQRALRVVETSPEAFPIDLGKTRKCVLARFPYSVMYYIDAGQVVVSSVAHQRQRHRYWRDRA